MTTQSLPRRRRAATPPVRTHVGYVRVSTEDQVENGVSLDAQRERLTAHAVAMGRELASVASDEGVSAKSLDRPALTALLAAVRAGRIASVTVLKLDRLTRSVRDLGELLEIFRRADCALVSVTEALDTTSASGRMVVNMLGVFAQWERETIGERTSFALAHKRRNGRVYNRMIPYGYAREGERLVSEAEQQAALASMRELRAAGMSFAAIAADLERRSVPPPHGARWHSTSVRNVLLSKMTLEDAA